MLALRCLTEAGDRGWRWLETVGEGRNPLRLSQKLQIISAIWIVSFFLGSCGSDEQAGSSEPPTVDTAGYWAPVFADPNESYFDLTQIGVRSSGSAFLGDSYTAGPKGVKCTPSYSVYDMDFWATVSGNELSGLITSTITPISCDTSEGGNCYCNPQLEDCTGAPTGDFSILIELEVSGSISYFEQAKLCVFEGYVTMTKPAGFCSPGNEIAVGMYYCPRATPFSPCEAVPACPVPTD